MHFDFKILIIHIIPIILEFFNFYELFLLKDYLLLSWTILVHLMWDDILAS